MKVFKNIVIIALIGLLSSTYLFNLSPINYKGSIEIETPQEKSTLSLDFNESQNLFNPKTIVINHITEKEEVIKSVTNNIFTVDVYKNEKLILNGLNDLELVTVTKDTTFTIDENNPMITTLDISQEHLGLEDGTYNFVFNSNLISEEKNSTVSVDVTYDTTGTYYPALNAAPAGTKGLTLYFTTKNADALIPVTRFVVEDKSITRMAIEQLQNGPADTGLSTVIGDVTNTTYNNGNVVIDIPSSYTQYNNGSTGGGLSYNAFTKTIFAVDRYWPIYNVSFTVDRKVVDNYFHGKDQLNKIPNEEESYLIYLSYKVGERYYLFDYPVKLEAGIIDNDTIEIKADKLFGSYKDVELNYGRNPIPTEISLNKAKQEGNILILDFNDDFKNAYKDKDDLKQMMIESIIYTFTTIPNIDSVIITINNEPLSNFVKDKDYSGILYPPEFINPEVVGQ